MSGDSSVSATWKGVLLALLAVQGSAHALCIRWSRGVRDERYSVLSTLIVSELLKLLLSLSLVVATSEPRGLQPVLSRLRCVFSLRDSLVMSVPAALYMAQSLLSFYALHRLDSATYATVAQLKLLFTALCAVWLLGKRLQACQWRAVLLLFVGVVITQTHYSPLAVPSQQPSLPAEQQWQQQHWLSVMAVVSVAVLSSLAGIYFEFFLKQKDSRFDVWDRNVQLSCYGLLLLAASLPLQQDELQRLRSRALFADYSPLALVIVALGSSGGLLVALVTLLLDNIAKNFASVASVVLTAIVSGLLMRDAPLDANLVCGTAAVVLAMLNYSDIPAVNSEQEADADVETSAGSGGSAQGKYSAVPIAPPQHEAGSGLTAGETQDGEAQSELAESL